MTSILTLVLPAILAVAPPAFPELVPCAVVIPAGIEVGENDEYRDLYAGGQTFDAFLADAVRRKELWDGNWEASAQIDAEVIARARAVGGNWHILAVAIDSCSDSVNTIPYLARLAAMVEGVELRVIDPETGRGIMEAHPTPDGRPSTPTVLLLDADFEKKGCFIERPTPLQTRILENPEGLSSSEIYQWKMGWYEEDSGAETVREFVEIMEAAAAGGMVCGG